MRNAIRWTTAALGLLFTFGAADVAQAQGPVQFGAQVSYANDYDLGIGARAQLGLGQLVPGLFGIGSFDWFFPSEAADDFTDDDYDVNFWELNANLAYPITLGDAPLAPYVGGGLNASFVSFDVADESDTQSELGLNLLGGAQFGGVDAPVTPFAELRLEFAGGEQFVITGGVLF